MKKMISVFFVLFTLIISPNIFAEIAGGSTSCIYYDKKPHNLSESASKAEAYDAALINAKQSCMRSMNVFVAYHIEIVGENSVNEQAQSGGQCWKTSTRIRFSCIE